MANQKLNIVITAFDKTKSAFRGISAGIGAVTSAVFSLKTALVGVVGAAGLGLLVRNSLQATDALAKTADKLGVTTQELSALRYAAELSGVGIQTTDMAVQRFTRRLAEAAQGTGEAKGALRELGIDASQLINLSLDEQMIALANSFSKVQNSSDKVRLAFKLFDSEGVSFISLLNKGSEGIRQMVEEAGGLGVIMSSKAAKGVEEANDAFTKLSSLLRGIIDQTVAALAPALTALAELFQKYLVESIGEANDAIEKFGQNAARYIVESVADILDVLAAAVIGFEAYINMLEQNAVWGKITQNAFKGMKTDLSLFIFDIQKAAINVRNLGSKIGNPGDGESLVSSINNAKPPLTDMEMLLQKVSKAFQKATEQSTSLQDTLDSGVQRAMKATTDGLADMVLGAKSAKDAFKDMARSIIADLARMFIQQQITQPLFSTIGGFFSSAGATPTGAPLNPILSGNGGGFTGIGARAGGIDGKGGFPAILHPNETVVDHTKGQGMGGAVAVTLNISTGVSQTVRAEIANLMPQITEATKGAVLEARQRGGSYSRGLAGI